MIIEGLEQQSVEWLMQRIGMCTGSRVSDVMGKLKSGKGYLAGRNDYMWELVIERLTGRAEDHYSSPAMEWGVEYEPLARAAYEIEMDVEVEKVGFATHPKIEWFGASPDGLIGKDGLLEIKCPKSRTHCEYRNAGVVPEEYKPQMLAEMACAERQWVDFVSFDPRLPKHLQLFVRRFHRDEEKILAMEQEVETFLAEVATMHEQIQKAVQ